jgi:hypothetical protein
MRGRTRIFICHKKTDAEGRENNSASRLYDLFNERQEEYDVWMDEGIHTGDIWEEQIYEHLLAAHVLMLAVGDGTSQSEWVRRELSMATAFGIKILPVNLNLSDEQLRKEIAGLGLTSRQHTRPFNIESKTARGIVDVLKDAIEAGRAETESRGYELLKKIAQRVQPAAAPPASANLTAASRLFKFGNKDISVHIASGDIFRLSNYDFLVNSENDFMQMARIFDMASLSSIIRYRGSSKEKGFLEDTIQSEIEKEMVKRPRPVLSGTAIYTSSGGPDSDLYKINKVSHVIHVAAVHADLDKHRIDPITEDGKIRECVTSALAAAQDICRAHGIISPEDSRQYALQKRSSEAFSPKRLVLPLFGTGRGGLAAADVGSKILEAIVDFFLGPLFDEEYMPLTDIHLSVFSAEDVKTMATKLAAVQVGG